MTWGMEDLWWLVIMRSGRCWKCTIDVMNEVEGWSEGGFFGRLRVDE